MAKFAFAAIAAAASMGAVAMASPMSFSLSVETESEAKAEDRGVIDTIFSTTASAFNIVFNAGGSKSDEDLILRYLPVEKQGCEAEEPVETEEAKKKPTKKKPAGPEPIYFGF